MARNACNATCPWARRLLLLKAAARSRSEALRRYSARAIACDATWIDAVPMRVTSVTGQRRGTQSAEGWPSHAQSKVVPITVPSVPEAQCEAPIGHRLAVPSAPKATPQVRASAVAASDGNTAPRTKKRATSRGSSSIGNAVDGTRTSQAPNRACKAPALPRISASNHVAQTPIKHELPCNQACHPSAMPRPAGSAIHRPQRSNTTSARHPQRDRRSGAPSRDSSASRRTPKPRNPRRSPPDAPGSTQAGISAQTWQTTSTWSAKPAWYACRCTRGMRNRPQLGARTRGWRIMKWKVE